MVGGTVLNWETGTSYALEMAAAMKEVTRPPGPRVVAATSSESERGGQETLAHTCSLQTRTKEYEGQQRRVWRAAASEQRAAMGPQTTI